MHNLGVTNYLGNKIGIGTRRGASYPIHDAPLVRGVGRKQTDKVVALIRLGDGLPLGTAVAPPIFWRPSPAFLHEKPQTGGGGGLFITPRISRDPPLNLQIIFIK